MKITAVLGLCLALAVPALAGADELLPPPPPPPGDDLDGDLPPPRPAPRRPPPATPRGERPHEAGRGADQRQAPPKGAIGEGPLAAAGAIGAGLHPDEHRSNWRYALASGVAGRFNGYQLHTDQANAGVLISFGGQADGLWTEGFGHAARLRFRLYTGGERIVFLPSDGEVEAAYALGRREFRFVVGRVEVARYPGLALQSLVQVATMPSFEGSVPVAGDKVRLFYAVAPVEMAWVWYYGRAHIEHSAAWTTETDHPDAASAFRARVTFNVPPSILLSLQGDYLKFWGSVDQLTAAEASAGMAVLERTVLINVSMRWESFTRRGDRDHPGTSESADQFIGQAAATLVF
jgi:hypothetical protein